MTLAADKTNKVTYTIYSYSAINNNNNNNKYLKKKKAKKERRVQ